MNLVKLFTEVKRLLYTSNEAFTLYFELTRHIHSYSNKVLVILQNELALKQCYYKNMKWADNSSNEKHILYKDDIEYKLVTIDNLYGRSNPLRGEYFKEIKFLDGFERVFN